ncbi:ABC transporter ATP-binding protein [Immundisolibacter sp.]|uniref:ABC transporter ATP-binding protein n=1 Tax=Immundisolibacter sp. TaxID=1934948 RepID=UPI00263300FE|nr:ABC transporter ATP-binding protein [Immundisolibacter sp.]MDD3650578.1 ABC transporter ATP-binding protein [Immundisolibacter sp.]
MTRPLLELRDLRTEFRTATGPRTVVDGVSLAVPAGRTLVLLGESGSGKSVTALSILRLLPPGARQAGGEVWLDGLNLTDLPEAAMRDVRGRRIGMIFQEPMTSLNPVMRIGAQIAEVIRRHLGGSARAIRARGVELLAATGMADPERRYDEYPHQLSGGMKQRAMIAMALACDPELLIADEPTTALDVTTQAQILDLLQSLQRARGMGLLLVTHDLGVAARMADHVAVMQAGRVVEQAPRERFFTAPQHPYSRALFAALPDFSRRGQALTGAGADTHAPPPPSPAETVLDVRDLKVHFPIRRGLLQRQVGAVRAVDGVSLAVQRARTLAVVGESGCGKTTLARAILRLLEPTGGSVHFEGTDLASLPARRLRPLRRHFQIVFQDPYGSLNPRLRVADIVREGLDALAIGSRAWREQRVAQLLERVGLPADAGERYPHEFSGGQRQRISIARALAVEPRLLLLDEPTSALDLSIQAAVLDLLRELQAEMGLAYVLITHNLGVVEYLADQVAVMYLGRIVEHGPAEQVLKHPRHPYTRALLAAVPRVALDATPAPIAAGDPPSPAAPPSGCHYHPRCALADARCRSVYPASVQLDHGHAVACHHANRQDPDLPA